MELSLPTAVKFLHQNNKELSRNLSSYLALAAIDNSKLLAKHIVAILQSIISGEARRVFKLISGEARRVYTCILDSR